MNTLKHILSLPNESVFNYIIRKVKHLVGEEGILTDNENYLVILPDDYSDVALVSHIDTVRGEDILKIEDDGVIIRNRYGVLGADDRAGVYACLKIFLEAETKPCMFFFNYEESGCLGVKKFLQDYEFDEFNFKIFIELDRRGANDWVSYTPLGEITEQYITNILYEYGYIEQTGTVSDVKYLSEETKLAGINLSIGYYKEHTEHEFLIIPHLERTIEVVKELVEMEWVKTEIKELTTGYWDNYYSLNLSGRGIKDINYLGDDVFLYLYTRGIINNADKCTFCNKDWDKCVCGSIEDAIIEYQERNLSSMYSEDEIEYLIDIQVIDEYDGFCYECGRHLDKCECGTVIKALTEYWRLQEESKIASKI